MRFRDWLWCLAHLRMTRIDRDKKYIVALQEPLTAEMLANISAWLTQADVPLLIVRGPVQIVEGVIGKETEN
jgi:hypothetical protein